MHATDLVGINGNTRVLLAYTCQQGVYPRGHVLPLRLPYKFTFSHFLTVYPYFAFKKYTGTSKFHFERCLGVDRLLGKIQRPFLAQFLPVSLLKPEQ
jgi:hypothetical protein